MTVMPAPGDLALLERFVNTAELEQGTDALGDASQLAAWLADAGLAPAGEAFGEADRQRLVELREALRAVLVDHHDPAAVAALDRFGQGAPLVVAFEADGSARLAPAEAGVAGVVASLLAIVAGAQADGTWARLKACASETCRWAFYDRSRNRSRNWCSMSVCGNRAKARSYRARQR
jgi:predicted RNA-binding Zn ribbon-like protein